MIEKGAWPRSRDLLFKFWGPLISQECLMIQTSNFACCLNVRDTKRQKWKIGQKGVWPRSRDLLFKFMDSLISQEWLMIQTSNFACGLKERDTKPQNEKWVKMGRGLSHVTYFSNFGTP